MEIEGCTSVSRWKILRFMKMPHLYKNKRKPGSYWKMLLLFSNSQCVFTERLTSLPSKGRSCTFCLSLSWGEGGDRNSLFWANWSLLQESAVAAFPLPNLFHVVPIARILWSNHVVPWTPVSLGVSVWWGAENRNTVLIEVKRSWNCCVSDRCYDLKCKKRIPGEDPNSSPVLLEAFLRKKCLNGKKVPALFVQSL